MGSDTPLLKACPFCGEGRSLRVEDLGGEAIRYTAIVVRCEKCGGQGGDREEELASLIAWNTRVTQPDTGSAFECTEEHLSILEKPEPDWRDLTDAQIRSEGFDPEEFRKCMRGAFPEFPPTDTDSGTVEET